jgi:hypothetical protein
MKWVLLSPRNMSIIIVAVLFSGLTGYSLRGYPAISLKYILKGSKWDDVDMFRDGKIRINSHVADV